MGGERGWVVVLWAREEVCVEEVRDRSLATHIGGCSVVCSVPLQVVNSGVDSSGGEARQQQGADVACCFCRPMRVYGVREEDSDEVRRR